MEAACIGGAIILVLEVIARSIFLVSPRSVRVSMVKAVVLTALTTPNSPWSGGLAGWAVGAGVGGVTGVGVGTGQQESELVSAPLQPD